MPRDAFDTFLARDRKEFGVDLKRNLRTALESLKRFSNSVRAGRYPEWPTEAELSFFVSQVEAFRLISQRGSKARPIHLIHEMDHRWKGLQIVHTLDDLVDNLESYIGNSLLAEANAKAIKRRADPREDEWRRLIFRKRNPEPRDLQLMADVLPTAFQAMIKLTSDRTLRPQTGARADSVDKLREALARSAQEYLYSEHRLYVAKLQLARELRTFIHQLKHRPYTKRLHGFSPEHVKQWDAADHRQLARNRQQRFRAKKSGH